MKRATRLTLQFVVHTILAGWVTVAIAGLLELGLGALTGLDRQLDRYFWGPTFLAPALLGVLGGFLAGKRSGRLVTWFVFLVPLLWLIWEVNAWVRLEPSGSATRRVLFDNFWGTQCAGSECLEQPLITAPLVAAIAYSLGAELGRLREFVRRNGDSRNREPAVRR